MTFLQKHKPRAIAEMAGNKQQAAQLKKFVMNWKKGAALLLSGPPGCGKSLSAELVAAELALELVEGAPSEVLASSRQFSMWKKGKLLVVDLDMPEATAKAFLELVNQSTWPIAGITEDAYKREFKELRQFEILRYQKIYTSELSRLIINVCRKEGIKCDERAAFNLAAVSDGDARFALVSLESLKEVSLQSVAEIQRDRVEKVFDLLDAVFFGKKTEIEDLQAFMPWLAENIRDRYAGPALARAYICLALADMALKRRQDDYAAQFLQFMPQSGIRAQYRPPQWIAKSADLAALAKAVHCSTRKAKAYQQVAEKLAVQT